MIMNKIFINKSLLLLLICGLLLTSCYKKFDPKSYQPAFTINGYTSVAEIGAGSLVGYWAFNGNYVDSISNTAGTGANTSFTGGFKGQALQGALNGYVVSPSSNAIKNLQSFTIYRMGKYSATFYRNYWHFFIGKYNQVLGKY